MLSVIATGTLVAQAEAVAPKLGAACAKLNQTQVAAGYAYTCIKSGKKLVWSRRVKIAVPVPAASASPTPSPTLSVTPTVSSAPQKNNLQILYDSINQQISKGDLSTIPITRIDSPDMDTSAADKVFVDMTNALSLWVSRLGPYKQITFLFMNQNDKLWFDQQTTRLEGRPDTYWWGSVHNPGDANQEHGRGTFANGSSIFDIYLGTQLTINNPMISHYHEVVHMYQQSYWQNRGYQLTPPWFLEGQAEFFAEATASPLKDVGSQRRMEIRSIPGLTSHPSNPSAQDLLDLIHKCDGDLNFTFNNGLGYTLGMVLNEYLYSQYSVDQVQKLMSDVTTGTSWKTVFQSDIGNSYEKFELDAAQYISDQIRQIS